MKKPTLRQRLIKWLTKDDRDQEVLAINTISKGPSIERMMHNSIFDTEPIRLNIYIANGGKVVETKSVDRKRDTVDTQLYVINDDLDLGEELSKIITLTSLRQ